MTSKLKDESAVLAAETLLEYCQYYGCERCVFNSNGYCQFDLGLAPAYWDIPDDYKSKIGDISREGGKHE